MDPDSSTGLNEDSESGECDSPSDENTNNTIDFDSTSKLSANSERTNIDALDDTARDTLLVPPVFDDSNHSSKSLKKRSAELAVSLRGGGDHDHDVLDFEGDDTEDNLKGSSDARNKILNSVNDDDDEEEGELEDDEKSEKFPDLSSNSMSPGPALEEGECADEKPRPDKGRRKIVYHEDSKDEDEGEDDELEEGEVTDDEDRNNKEPKPVCRFFGKGQCTWGSNCRFLHPGVTDKGLYTMFDPMRPLLPLPSNPASSTAHTVKPGLLGIAPPNFAPIIKPEEPVIESAWERGLRHAKEIIKQSVKRKETDIDFEEKKMNLTLAQEEIDKENDYYVRKPDSPERSVAPIDDDPYMEAYDLPSSWNSSQIDIPPIVVRQTVTSQKIDPDFVRERVHRIHKPVRSAPPRDAPRDGPGIREAPPLHEPEVRMVRESVLRRGNRNFQDPYTGEGSSRGSRRNYEDPRKAEEWHDPWMRTKSPSGRRRKDSSVSKRSSYSSGSSRSSSRSNSNSSKHSSSSSRSSSQSSKSSRGSKSPATKKRRRSREEVRKAPPRRISPKPMRIAPPPPPKEEFGRRIPSSSSGYGGGPSHFERPTRFAPSPPKIPGHLKDRLPEKNNLPLVRERDLKGRGGNHSMHWNSRSTRSRSSRSDVSSPSAGRNRRSRSGGSRSSSRSRSLTKQKSNKRSKFSRDKSNSASDRSLSRNRASSRSSSSSSSSSSSLGSLPKASRVKRRAPSIEKPEVVAVENPIREMHAPPRIPQIKKVDSGKGQAPQTPKSQIKMTLKGSSFKANKNVLDRLADDLQGDRGSQSKDRSRSKSKDEGDRTPVPSPEDESSKEALSFEEVGSNDVKDTSPKDSKLATKRREELLKQLKAVEDAIAKKRSKLERL